MEGRYCTQGTLGTQPTCVVPSFLHLQPPRISRIVFCGACVEVNEHPSFSQDPWDVAVVHFEFTWQIIMSRLVPSGSRTCGMPRCQPPFHSVTNGDAILGPQTPERDPIANCPITVSLGTMCTPETAATSSTNDAVGSNPLSGRHVSHVLVLHQQLNLWTSGSRRTRSKAYKTPNFP
jgi:hypothetical protein